MTLGATLNHLHLQSPDPKRCSEFYANTYAMDISETDGAWLCEGNGRKVVWSEGAIGVLKHAEFHFIDDAAWDRFCNKHRHDPSEKMTTVDPDGNRFVFAQPDRSFEQHQISADLPRAYLQHFAIRTPDVAKLVEFYEAVGFVVSDRVFDDTKRLKACFMRTSELHHVMAIFEAPVACFDHQSFETHDWHGLKVWADHMASKRIEIVWGIGRHGPGNDVFFMVRDPDGNLAEISAEIEVCAPDRPAGIWPHEERTLNVWGKAIMRS